MDPLFQAIDRLMTGVETRTYSDGATATGPAPLPLQSPTQQEHVAGLVEDYGQWMWDAGYMDDPTGEALVDDAAQRRKEIKDAVDAAQLHAYAEGRKDEREAIDTGTLLAALRELPFVTASEIDGEESDGTPRHYRSRRYVSLTKLESLLRARLGAL